MFGMVGFKVDSGNEARSRGWCLVRLVLKWTVGMRLDLELSLVPRLSGYKATH